MKSSIWSAPLVKAKGKLDRINPIEYVYIGFSYSSVLTVTPDVAKRDQNRMISSIFDQI